MTQINLRIAPELLGELDAARPVAVSRNKWIVQAIEMRLRRKQEVAAASQPGPNVENIRSSTQIKRGVEPLLKGGKHGKRK